MGIITYEFDDTPDPSLKVIPGILVISPRNEALGVGKVIEVDEDRAKVAFIGWWPMIWMEKSTLSVVKNDPIQKLYLPPSQGGAESNVEVRAEPLPRTTMGERVKPYGG